MFRRLKLIIFSSILMLCATGTGLLSELCAAEGSQNDGTSGGSVNAAEPAAMFFEKEIRPLLIDQCLDCHSVDNAESELRMDSRQGLLKGGLRGPAIIVGKPEESLLIRALRHGELLKMPPRRKLSATTIEKLAKWIADGAVWPGGDSAPQPDPANPDPAGSKSGNGSSAVDIAAGREFWAFQPLVDHPLPEVRNPELVRTPIDAFILRKLDKANLSPAPKADKRTLLRRLTFDLIGLPPTPADLDAFLTDESPDAWNAAIERLLASPHYGERWGRHWLDVARYADSNGLDENLAHANAWRYRDYVVRAFNADRPFDRFIHEQLAGDLLTDPATPQEAADRIIATGFLCIGPKMLAEDDPVKLRMDIIDEQIDTIGQAFLGLTLGCARCHDHKFDPVPGTDYYALAGIFKSTQTMDSFTVVAQWHERPIVMPEAVAARDAHQQQIDAVTAEIRQLTSVSNQKLIDTARGHIGDYLLTAETERRRATFLADRQPFGNRPADEHPQGSRLIEAEAFDRGNVNRDTTSYGVGIGVLVNAGPQPNFTEYDLTIDAAQAGTYLLEVRYAAASARPTLLMLDGQLLRRDIADGVTGTWFPDSQRWEIESLLELPAGRHVLRLEHPQFFPHIDKLLLVPVDAELPAVPLLADGFEPVPEFVTNWVVSLEAAEKTLATDADSAAKLPAALREWLTATRAGTDADQLRTLARQAAESAEVQAWATAAAGPLRMSDTLRSSFPDNAQQQLAEREKQREQLQASLPQLPTAMAVEDTTVEDVRVHYRGNHLTQGDVVPRGFLSVLTNEPQAIPSDRSGRLELARWMTSPGNPLTPRVIVNRIWHWHFGQGLVRSPDNFGRLGERPTHPELLDWLTVEFVRSGWSIKHLHRLILKSSTWQQACLPSPGIEDTDPDNRLWSYMPRRRLEAEAMRDAILQISGRLNRDMGGSLLPTENRKYVTSTANVDPVVYASDRRSIYLPVVRSALFNVFAAFDFADPGVLNGSRQSTTVASQALFMMNSEFVADHTRHLAIQIVGATDITDAEHLRRIYFAALSRPPDGSETARSLAYLDAYVARWNELYSDRTAEARERAWQSLIRTIIASNEFLFLE